MTTVLLVEDNPIDIKAVTRSCGKLGLDWDINSLTDGQAAIDYASTTPTTPNLILLDLNLPGLDGKDVLRKLRGTDRYLCVPILVVTTSTTPQDITDSYRLGANAVIAKPDNLAAWQAMLSSTDEFWVKTIQRC